MTIVGDSLALEKNVNHAWRKYNSFRLRNSLSRAIPSGPESDSEFLVPLSRHLYLRNHHREDEGEGGPIPSGVITTGSAF